MNIILEFDDKEQALDAMNGSKYREQIDEIWMKVFRPSYKHGYGDELLDSEQAGEVIERLARIYREVVAD